MLGPMRPGTASATITGCRSDPYVILSNGAQFDLTASISTDASNVKQTRYVLHGPQGTSVVAVVATDGLIGLSERFTYYADDSPGTYDSATTVTTVSGNSVPVTATGLVTALNSLGVQSKSGHSEQALAIHYAPPA